MIGAEQIGDVVDVPAGHELRELDAELSLERGNGIGTRIRDKLISRASACVTI